MFLFFFFRRKTAHVLKFRTSNIFWPFIYVKILCYNIILLLLTGCRGPRGNTQKVYLIQMLIVSKQNDLFHIMFQMYSFNFFVGVRAGFLVGKGSCPTGYMPRPKPGQKLKRKRKNQKWVQNLFIQHLQSQCCDPMSPVDSGW